MSTALALSQVSVRKHRTSILNELSLRLATGSLLAILGPNGAGKSTLLQALLGLVRATGALDVLGVAVTGAPGRELVRLRRRVGYVPQLYARPAAVLPLSVREVVALGRIGLRGAQRRGDRQAYERIMEQLELGPLADRPLGVLSGGEQRKVYLARALAQEPEILLLDEPAGHLDFRWQELITQLIGRVWRVQALTVVMVTHDLRHLPACTTQVALLRAGRLLCMGPPAEVLNGPGLSELYGLTLRVTTLNQRYWAVPEDAP